MTTFAPAAPRIADQSVPLDQSMSSAFLVIVAKRCCGIPQHLERRAGRADPPGLHFTPTQNLLWRDGCGQLLLAAWERPAECATGRWLAGSTGAAVIAGRYRRTGEPWAAPSQSVRQFVEAVEARGLRPVLQQSIGAFAVASVWDDGGYIACDPMGFGFLFHAESEDVVVFSTRAELAAWAIAAPGQPPTKDPLGACRLVYAPYSIGDRTGFAGVRLLPEGSEVRFVPGAAPVIGGEPAPWLRDGGLRSHHCEAVLDRITEVIADELSAALALPAETRYVDLTGGKDSRLLLAVALESGIASKFTFRTTGPPGLRDVQIAAHLATSFGLRYESGMFWTPDDRPYAQRAANFVEAVGGTVNVWDMKAPRASPAEVRVSGMTGECLRAGLSIHPLPSSADELFAHMRRCYRRGSLDVFRPEAEQSLDEILNEEIAADPVGGSDPVDLLGTFLIRNSARKGRGPRDELESDFRIWPLCSLAAVRGAYAVGSALRQDEFVHFEIMRRQSPELASCGFAGPDWVGHLRELLPAVDLGVQTPDAGKPEELIARGHRLEFDEQRTFLDEVLRDHHNRIWEVLDQTRTIAALDRFDSLANKQRRQLFGAATAALWLR